MIRYADLFCGIGAFHQAFKEHGSFSCVMASDINEGARRIYNANHGLEPLGDIREVKEESVPDLDLICAGIQEQRIFYLGNSIVVNVIRALVPSIIDNLSSREYITS